MQKENWRCLDSWVEALRLGLERQTDIKPIQIQIKIAVAWIPQRELSGLFVCPSDSVFWIRVPRPILNRYRTQSKHWCCLDSSDLLVCSADSVFWKGVSRPISNRYRIQRENGFCLDYRCARALRLAFMTFRFDVLDGSFRPNPNRYRIQNKSYCCLDSCEVAFRLAFMIFRFDFLDRSFRLLI